MTTSTYLDYAATAAIRPPQVADAVAAYLRDVGATPGRSTHARALAAGRLALRCRQLLAELFGIEGDPGRIAMQFNATHALNTALYGLLSPGDTIVRTALDHNAVRRPVAALVRSGVRERVLSVDSSGQPDLNELTHLLRGEGTPPARLLALPHASNVIGTILPVREMSDRAHEFGALVLVDAAQTAGHFPFRVDDLGIDLLAFTGHKGLLGPQGTGGLWVRDGIDVAPLLRGGTGGDSVPAEMPEAYPDHLEAGTQNAPGIAGLAAALDWLVEAGIGGLWAHELELKARLIAGLVTIPAVRILSPDGPGVGIVTLVLDGWDPGELAAVLEKRFGIQGRAGLHCAPEAHGVLGTLGTGAYRLSIGWDTSADDVDRAADAIRQLSLEIRES